MREEARVPEESSAASGVFGRTSGPRASARRASRPPPERCERRGSEERPGSEDKETERGRRGASESFPCCHEGRCRRDRRGGRGRKRRRDEMSPDGERRRRGKLADRCHEHSRACQEKSGACEGRNFPRRGMPDFPRGERTPRGHPCREVVREGRRGRNHFIQKEFDLPIQLGFHGGSSGLGHSVLRLHLHRLLYTMSGGKRSRRARRARKSLFLTVPSGIPFSSAISS